VFNGASQQASVAGEISSHLIESREFKRYILIEEETDIHLSV